MTELADRRLCLAAPLPPEANRFVSLSEDLAPAWGARALVPPGSRHLVLLELGGEQARAVRLATRIVADALPQAFRANLDMLEVTAGRASLIARDETAGVRHCQAALLGAARRRGLALDPATAAPRPHVVLSHGPRTAEGTVRIDGIGWRVEELRLLWGAPDEAAPAVLDSWRLPEHASLAA